MNQPRPGRAEQAVNLTTSLVEPLIHRKIHSLKQLFSLTIRSLKGAGQWTAKGYIFKQYNNRVYKIQLDPKNPDSFSEEENPVRKFQWKLTGHIPDLSLNLYYGGYVELYRDLNAEPKPTSTV